MANEQNGNGNKPFWVKLFLQVGIPSALAILLLATLLGWMPSPLMKSIERIEYRGWETSALLRAICHNLARDREERVLCEPWKLRETP